MVFQVLRVIFDMVHYECDAPQRILDTWPELLHAASFRVRKLSADRHFGKVNSGIGNWGTAKVRVRPRPTESGAGDGGTVVLTGGTSVAVAVVRTFLYHGATLDPARYSWLCYSLFACRLDATLIKLLQETEWLLDQDGDEAELDAVIDPLVGARVMEYISKSRRGIKGFICLGAVGGGNVYCAFQPYRMSLEQWRASSAYREVHQKWTAAGFTELPIFGPSK